MHENIIRNHLNFILTDDDSDLEIKKSILDKTSKNQIKNKHNNHKRSFERSFESLKTRSSPLSEYNLILYIVYINI